MILLLVVASVAGYFLLHSVKSCGCRDQKPKPSFWYMGFKGRHINCQWLMLVQRGVICCDWFRLLSLLYLLKSTTRSMSSTSSDGSSKRPFASCLPLLKSLYGGKQKYIRTTLCKVSHPSVTSGKPNFAYRNPGGLFTKVSHVCLVVVSVMLCNLIFSSSVETYGSKFQPKFLKGV